VSDAKRNDKRKSEEEVIFGGILAEPMLIKEPAPAGGLLTEKHEAIEAEGFELRLAALIEHYENKSNGLIKHGDWEDLFISLAIDTIRGFDFGFIEEEIRKGGRRPKLSDDEKMRVFQAVRREQAEAAKSVHQGKIYNERIFEVLVKTGEFSPPAGVTEEEHIATVRSA
jgi:hypothetical protein